MEYVIFTDKFFLRMYPHAQLVVGEKYEILDVTVNEKGVKHILIGDEAQCWIRTDQVMSMKEYRKIKLNEILSVGTSETITVGDQKIL